MPIKNTSIELTLTAMAPTGQAIGRHNGRVVFVPYSLPGEFVEVEIAHERRNYASGTLKRVIEPSPHRVSPRCMHYTDCGGCEWQHIAPTMQLQYKTHAMRDQLQRIAGLRDVDVRDCLASPREYGYRNHTQFILSATGKFAYYKAHSHDAVEINECPILCPLLQTNLHSFNLSGPAASGEMLNRHSLTSVKEIHLRCGENTNEFSLAVESADHAYKVISGQDLLHETIENHRYQISAPSFFQVNSGTARVLVNVIQELLQLSGQGRVLELYSGVGLLTYPISQQARFVLAIESSTFATADAQVNLQDRDNVKIVTNDVWKWLSLHTQHPTIWDAIVMDPPRSGVSYAALQNVLKLQAEHLVYVSCDPATLARDAQMICRSGYAIVRVQPLDMFPQTHHVESVTLFKRL